MRGNCGHLHVIEIDLKPAQNHAGCRCSLEWKFPFIAGQFGSEREKELALLKETDCFAS